MSWAYDVTSVYLNPRRQRIIKKIRVCKCTWGYFSANRPFGAGRREKKCAGRKKEEIQRWIWDGFSAKRAVVVVRYF